jgi:hypothetical protein
LTPSWVNIPVFMAIASAGTAVDIKVEVHATEKDTNICIEWWWKCSY